jgi:hypothetical protein
MPHTASIRYAAAATFAFSALLCAQARHISPAKPRAATPVALPVTPPTTRQELPPTPAEMPSHPASVSYTNGMLDVSADNSSLVQILHEISLKTGMKITGGVTDERVFGQYGPAPAAQILNKLLDGTGSNMMLVESDGTSPAELILTSRQGGATPPNPNAASVEDNDQPDEQGPKQSLQPIEPQTNPAAVEPAQPQSPNGVRTPQDIYDQLRKLRQQQAKPQ